MTTPASKDAAAGLWCWHSRFLRIIGSGSRGNEWEIKVHARRWRWERW